MCETCKERVEISKPKFTKLQRIYLKECRGVDVSKLYENVLFSEENGFQSNGKQDVLMEYSDLISRFMKRWGIGKGLSDRLWSKTARNQIQTSLRQSFDSLTKEPSADPLKVYDEVRGRVADKYSQGEIARVARTETAKMRGVMQLLQWDEAGIEEVTYRARPGARASHANLNGKRFKIKELLRDEDKRIPIAESPFNCRCFYSPYIQGITN